jgi:hypothetical protein
MIVDLSTDGSASLLEPDDFQRLKIVVPPGLPPPANEGITFIDADHALISRTLIPHLAAAGASAAWLERYDAMLAAAARHGWIDDVTQWIKVHVER